MISALEHWAAQSFLRPKAVAISVGADSEAWVATAQGAHPTADAHIATADSIASQMVAHGIRHVQLLRLTGGVALDALQSVAPLLRYARIDAIAFVGVAPDLQAKIEMTPSLSDYAFIRPKGMAMETAGGFVALHRRLVPLFGGQKKEMLDLPALCRAHRIAPAAVIHVGANDGAEYEMYAGMGIGSKLFVEANPAAFARLQTHLAGKPGVTIACCAVVEHAGPVTLHLSSRDEASSVLPMGPVLNDHYPSIFETGRVEVPGKPLDLLLEELALRPAPGALLNIDVQGAELMVLKGATQTLPHIAAINVEVNFGEIYQGCAQVEEIEDFLMSSGFHRVALTSPYDPAWGDAFYVRAAAP